MKRKRKKYKRLYNRICIFCKELIKKPQEADWLVGGSAKDGKPMHSECYYKMEARLFRM
tara:strand:- start:2811 stop:2987 length:177 start_codon:yes stop_codon:yes gene_type:complete